MGSCRNVPAGAAFNTQNQRSLETRPGYVVVSLRVRLHSGIPQAPILATVLRDRGFAVSASPSSHRKCFTSIPSWLVEARALPLVRLAGMATGLTSARLTDASRASVILYQARFTNSSRAACR